MKCEKTEFTTGMDKNLGKFRCPSGSIFTVHPLSEVDDTGPNSEPPAHVSETMLCRIEGERPDIVWIDRVAHKATRGVSVKANHEEECEMMGIPERFKALGSDLMVGSGIH